MKIKEIFDEIANENSTKNKIEILKKYQDNKLLKRILYLANSKRIKFFIKQIPEYSKAFLTAELDNEILDSLFLLSNRTLRGHEAIQHLSSVLSLLENDDAYIIERIIEKDCKIGMGTTFMNKVYPNLIEETPYMGAISFDEKKARAIFDNNGIGYSQIKMDGRYCNAIIRSGEVELESRSGEATILTGAKFLSELINFDDCVLNGELTIKSVPRYESNGIIASLIDIESKRTERSIDETNKKIKAFNLKHGDLETALNSITYTVWDTISVDEYFEKKSKVPYNERLNNLKNMIIKSKAVMVELIETREVKTYSEAINHFQEVLSTEVNGVPQEGTILKFSISPWKDGKPNWSIKMKLEMDIDLRITGFNYGSKGTKNEKLISSFNAESSDGLLKTKPQGLKEEMMSYVTENQEELLGKIIQVKCNGLSNDKLGNYSLLYPSFVCIRDDKNTCDSLESIKSIENMIKTLK